MKKTKKAVLGVLLIGIAALTITACGHHAYDEAHRSQYIMKRISDRLDLNNDQQEKLQAINAEIQTGLKKYRDQQQQLFESLIKDVQEPKMNKQLLMEIVQSREKAYNDIAPHVIDKIIDFQASLNADQKKKLAEYLGHWRDRIQARQ